MQSVFEYRFALDIFKNTLPCRVFLNTVQPRCIQKHPAMQSVFEYRAASIDTNYRSGNCVGNSLKASLWHTLKSA